MCPKLKMKQCIAFTLALTVAQAMSLAAEAQSGPSCLPGADEPLSAECHRQVMAARIGEVHAAAFRAGYEAGCKAGGEALAKETVAQDGTLADGQPGLVCRTTTAGTWNFPVIPDLGGGAAASIRIRDRSMIIPGISGPGGMSNGHQIEPDWQRFITSPDLMQLSIGGGLLQLSPGG